MGDGLMAVFRSAADAVVVRYRDAASRVRREPRSRDMAVRVARRARRPARPRKTRATGTARRSSRRRACAARRRRVRCSCPTSCARSSGSRGGHRFDDGIVVRPQGAARTGARVRGVVGAADRHRSRRCRPRSKSPAEARSSAEPTRSRSRRRDEARDGGRPADGAGERRARARARRGWRPRWRAAAAARRLARAVRPLRRGPAARVPSVVGGGDASLVAALPDDALDRHLDAFGGALAATGFGDPAPPTRRAATGAARRGGGAARARRRARRPHRARRRTKRP